MREMFTLRDALAAAFFSGGAWMIIRQIRKEVSELRKELNGVGGRQRKFERNAVLLWMVLLDKREEREIVARFFQER